ncbi:QRFP-like peptide receptor [Tribolium madens]|uniref:QRFP-like peptide receptor n=1 Tax=Tribolium madens TaxID=41895 RepID=UPI001CF73971|nr:QRFP-like peptide receptor [Tribolium madens]
MSNDCMIKNQVKSKENSNQQSNCVLPESLDILTASSRHIFTGIYVVILVVSLFGNCAAIYSISKRKYRFVQKTCIISLAISDILSTIVIGTNNLETFSHELLVWTLGPFLCSFIPMCQMVGITASSTALVIIAMDRYRNVVHVLSKRWDPPPLHCLSVTAILWLIIFGISYPMYDFFIQEDVTIVYVVDIEQNLFNFVDAKVCVSFDKANMKTYFIIMVILIFLPLLMIFLWFYYNIASLVWKHRKPLSSAFNKNETSGIENSSSHLEVKMKTVKHMGKNRDIRVERKIRTFKVLVTLMMVFIICRLPYFTVFILKLSLTEEYGLWTWYLNYAFMALHILNCCLNPLLYTFLNQTLTVWIKVKKVVKDFTWEICCFCFSKAEFDEFERENPFIINNHNRKGRNSKVKFEENVQEIEAKY